MKPYRYFVAISSPDAGQPHSTTDGQLLVSADHDDEFDMFAQSRKSTFEESRKMYVTHFVCLFVCLFL